MIYDDAFVAFRPCGKRYAYPRSVVASDFVTVKLMRGHATHH